MKWCPTDAVHAEAAAATLPSSSNPPDLESSDLKTHRKPAAPLRLGDYDSRMIAEQQKRSRRFRAMAVAE